MNDRGLSILDQYDLRLRNTRRGRGALILETDQGVKLLKEVTSSPKRAEAINLLQSEIYNAGFHLIDTFVCNKEGAFLSYDKDGTPYIIKNWFEGRECDVKSESEIMAAVRSLAKLHNVMVFPELKLELEERYEAEDLIQQFARHNRELKKVRGYIQKKRRKSDFEVCFMDAYNLFYAQCEKTLNCLQMSQYEELRKNSLEKQTVCHGEYNHHNILMTAGGIATTNFDKFTVDVQIADLYHFLRKIMEKNHWNRRLGMAMLDSYSSIRPIRNEELYHLGIRLSYPEKFWKIANHYYNNNKAWIPGKNIEKLTALSAQEQSREAFLRSVFHR